MEDNFVEALAEEAADEALIDEGEMTAGEAVDAAAAVAETGDAAETEDAADDGSNELDLEATTVVDGTAGFEIVDALVTVAVVLTTAVVVVAPVAELPLVLPSVVSVAGSVFIGAARCTC